MDVASALMTAENAAPVWRLVRQYAEFSTIHNPTGGAVVMFLTHGVPTA